jgi:hypothetical protein
MANWLESTRTQKCAKCKSAIEVGDQVYRKQASVYYCVGCGLTAENEALVVGAIEQGVEDDLATLPDEANKTALAQSMLKLARALDMDDVPPREVPGYTKEIRLLYMQLRDLFPATEGEDPTSQAQDIRDRRAREMGGI